MIGENMRQVLFILTLLILFDIVFPLSNTFAQQGSRYICKTIDRESGNCLSWEELPRAPDGATQSHNSQPSYDNDYRIPPRHKQKQLFEDVPSGTSFMPSTQYAPGIGSGIPPVAAERK